VGNKATIAGLPILATSPVSWDEIVGTSPYTTTVQVAKKAIRDPDSLIGKPTTLDVQGTRGRSFTVQNVYITGIFPGGHPDVLTVALADRRWLWPRTHVLRRYNVRRRTGDRRLLTEGVPGSEVFAVDDYFYEKATLREGSVMWDAGTALADVLAQVDGSGDMNGVGASTVPMENVEIDLSGDAAIRTLLGYITGTNVYVGIDGAVHFTDNQDYQGTNSVMRRFGPPVVGSGTARPSSLAGLRPSAVNVLFSIEQELKFTSVDEGSSGYSFRGGNTTKYLENVISLPDPSTTINGKSVARGTWVNIDAAFTAWGAPSVGAGRAAAPAMSQDLVRTLWLGGGLERLYGGLGNASIDGLWAARIHAVRQCYRQTYRISPYWMNRILSISGERVAIIDRENGSKAPAYVTGNYAYTPSVRGFLASPGTQFYVMNVSAYSDSLANSKQAPATVQILDPQLGVFHIAYGTDVLGRQAVIYPSTFDDPPALQFTKGTAQNFFMDGTVTAGANTTKLSASHKVAVVLTAVPSAPNTNDQLYRVRVTPGDVSSLGINVDGGSGPEWDIRLGAGVTTARFMWTDAAESTIDRLFGSGGATPSSKPTYSAADGLARAGLLVDQDEVTKLAKAAAASLYSQMTDRWMGGQGSLLDTSIHPIGNLTSVSHRLDPDGVLNTLVRFDVQSGRLETAAFLDNDTRRKLFRMVQA